MGGVFSRLAAGLAVFCALVLCGPAAAEAATISGTVSSETTHVGIGGVEVCPTPQPYTFETECTETDSSGHYALTSLPPASYMLYFSAFVNNLRYVSEFYDNKSSNLDADLVTLSSPEESRQIDVELAEGGSIAGTVIDDVTKQPIDGLAACAWNTGGAYQRCDKSDAAGHYEINGLPSGEYNVEYEGWNQVNYIRELYKDAETLAQDTQVPVTAPSTTSGIDAELARGAEILGHVSEVRSGAPVEGAMVCAPPQSEVDINENCDWTDAAGNYAIRGLPAGTYQVGFDVEFAGPFGGPTAFEWWQGASTRADATLLELTTPSSTTGINGKASRPYSPPPETPPVSVPSPKLPIVRPLPKCKKGFHRKLVKGKKRCVQKHHHRRHHRHPR
jgi:hypothetical protein